MLAVHSITKTYESKPVLNDVTFKINQGESLGVIGESGSGKSTLAKIVLGLTPIDQGEVIFQGVHLQNLKGKSLKNFRQHVQIVFQDPSSSLNPKLPVWKSVTEPLENYPEVVPPFLKKVRHDKKQMAGMLFNLVGLSQSLIEKYPHQLSGGQKQRVAIARAISLHPALLICDEPTSSLDVSVQAQILNLLRQLKQELEMSFIFISHDLAAVQFMCEQIAVLKDGELLETFPTEEIFSVKRHDYTKKLVEMAL